MRSIGWTSAGGLEEEEEEEEVSQGWVGGGRVYILVCGAECEGTMGGEFAHALLDGFKPHVEP